MGLVERRPDAYLSRRRRRYLRRCGANERADDVRFAHTDDGWDVAMSRYYPRGSRRRRPVLVCHGLAANRFTWDLDARTSLPWHLAQHGFDVFSLELRGHGRSQKNGPGGRWGWSTHDYADRDVPAALDAILELTGADGVHMVGHSMGGILLHARRALGDLRVTSGITVGSAVDYSATPSVFHKVAGLVGLTKAVPAMPLGPVARFMAPVALAVDNPIDRINVHPSNVDKSLYRRLCAVAFHAISSPVLQTLAHAMRPGGMLDADGAPLAFCPDDETPMLAIAGTADVQCHPEAAARTCSELRVFGREHGHVDDYGHFDLIMGHRAAEEVWPTIVEWLVAHDA